MTMLPEQWPELEIDLHPPHLQEWLDQLETERETLYRRTRAIERILIHHGRLRPERSLPRRVR